MADTEPGSRRRNNNINKGDLYKSFIPSALVLFASMIFGYVYQFIAGGNDSEFLEAITAYNKLWYYPLITYFVFVLCFLWVKNILDNKSGLSRKEVIKIIDKWGGFIDGIGTALPLVGAAVILFTVGLGSEELFLKFAVPFEIKSLFILAIAKLFEFAFDELEIQYLKYTPDSDIVSKIEIINLPDKETLEELNKVLTTWNTTVEKMENEKFKDVLNSIVKIIGR